jgi:hypothetical protein
MKQTAIVMSTAVLIAAGVACSTPANPSAAKTESPSTSSSGPSATPSGDAEAGLGTDALKGVSLVAPAPSTPAAGQTFKYAEQPVTLVVKNAAATGAAPTYTFQVSGDAAFSTFVVNQEGVAQGAGATTSLTLAKLAGGKTYFWRARATSSGTVGLFGAARSFNVGPEVVLQAPVLSSPGSGASVSGTITLVVNNVQRSGPVTAISYRFDLSNVSSFSPTLSTTTVAEQAGASTSWSANVSLGSGTYFWRVQAFDNASGVSSPLSTVSGFSYQPFSLSQATMVSSPQDFANWAETTKITSITFYPDSFWVDFDKRTGPNRWPDTPFGTGSLEYTLGMCINKDNHWYCSAVVQFWFERELSASGVPNHVNFEWFYDFARWGPMTGYQPQEGETVGIFVCAGDCRNNDAGDRSYVKERSNVAFVPWSNSGNGFFTFANGRRTK